MLTKEQIANLSTDQQETLATIELHRARNRQALLDEIRGLKMPRYRSWEIVVPWLLIFAMVYFPLQIFQPSPRNIIFAGEAAVVINFTMLCYTLNLSRRLKALVELLEHEGVLEAVPKRPPETDNQKP